MDSQSLDMFWTDRLSTDGLGLKLFVKFMVEVLIQTNHI